MYGCCDLVVQMHTDHVVCVIQFQNGPCVDENMQLVLSTCGYHSRNHPPIETVIGISVDTTFNAKIYLSNIERYLCRLFYVDNYNLQDSYSLSKFVQTIVNIVRNIDLDFMK